MAKRLLALCFIISANLKNYIIQNPVSHSTASQSAFHRIIAQFFVFSIQFTSERWTVSSSVLQIEFETSRFLKYRT